MKNTTALLRGIALGMLILFFNSCLKDECNHTYKIYKPIYKSLTAVRSSMKAVAPQEMKTTGKIYLWGKYVFIGEVDKGIHVIDNSDPANVKNIAFIYIPGNMDLAIKGNYLYADSYNDLVVFDISNPRNATPKKFVNDVFPDRRQFVVDSMTYSRPDSAMIAVDYVASDTTVSCDVYNYWMSCPYCAFASSSGGSFYAALPPNAGIGGSMARFTVINDFLYTVTHSDLYTFNVSNASEPAQVDKSSLGSWGVETIFPFRDKLFIGSNNGMFIYDISNPASPNKTGQFSHVRSCDPVIADDKFAYVTLRSGTLCQGFTNQMDILDISNFSVPQFVKTYPFTNPHGLSKDGNWLFVCDGKDGLKVYDASDVKDIKLKSHVEGLNTFDVIALNDIALVVAEDGLYQYDYSDISNIRLISKVEISK